MDLASMHPLLLRQLRLAGLAPDELPVDLVAWRDLLGRVDQAYKEADQDRHTIERSLSIASQEMQGLTEDLRHRSDRLEERTRELGAAHQALDAQMGRLNETQEQLLQSAKLAAVGTVVAGLSHELNNPLAIIVGYAQVLLQATPADSPSRTPLGAIERQALRCGHLVRTLLDCSRPKEPVRRPVSADELLAHVIELATGQARRCDITLERLEKPGELPMVLANRGQLESALLNLVMNALDATPRGGNVSLGAAASCQDGRSGLELHVGDTGSGIAPEVLPRIFDPFFTTKPVGQGNGLGLSLTRQIVESHQGRIGVDSAPGRGTTVRVWLPIVSAAAS